MKKKLEKYNQKRNQKKSPEPKGNSSNSNQPIFVIQKHDAQNLHYDFRLNIKGVLKSWAIPKGPTLNPDEKRLAIQTEDHPYEYKDFEGTIPKDQYGGGTVMIWDYGKYKNKSEKDDQNLDMEEAYKKGHIKIELNGKKMKGNFAMIRTDKESKEDAKWLFIKMDDDFADKRRKILKSEPHSAKTGKTLEDIEND
jgi:DNA ligase D-like protein (predicted 3'-phosphoesterase)